MVPERKGMSLAKAAVEIAQEHEAGKKGELWVMRVWEYD